MVAAFGCPFAEISLSDPDEVESLFDDFLRIRRESGIDYLAHYPNEDNPNDAEILRNRFLPRMEKLLALSGRLGIRKGTMHFWMDRRWIAPDTAEKKARLLSEIVALAVGNGVTLCIENLSERYDSFLPLFEAVPDLRMTLDIGHGELLSSRNTSYGFIEHCFDRIAHLHVHDNHGGTSVRDDLHLPLGQGVVDYRRILNLLREKNYSSTVTMEVKPADMPATLARILEEPATP
jgi:sugar phosphate isomerase/epimerase